MHVTPHRTLTSLQTRCCVVCVIFLHGCVLACNCFQAEWGCIACRKRHALRIGAAPEPSDIVWENLEITTAQRLQRRVFILLVNLIIIFAGVSPCVCVHAALPGCNIAFLQ